MELHAVMLLTTRVVCVKWYLIDIALWCRIHPPSTQPRTMDELARMKCHRTLTISLNRQRWHTYVNTMIQYVNGLKLNETKHTAKAKMPQAKTQSKRQRQETKNRHYPPSIVYFAIETYLVWIYFGEKHSNFECTK